MAEDGFYQGSKAHFAKWRRDTQAFKDFLRLVLVIEQLFLLG